MDDSNVEGEGKRRVKSISREEIKLEAPQKSTGWGPVSLSGANHRPTPRLNTSKIGLAGPHLPARRFKGPWHGFGALPEEGGTCTTYLV